MSSRSDLHNRLNAYSATLRTSLSQAARHGAGNWKAYAAVTGSALAMTTNASASIIYSGIINASTSISSVGHGGSLGVAGSHTHSNHQTVAVKSGAGVNFALFAKQQLQNHNLFGTVGLASTGNAKIAFLFNNNTQHIKHLASGNKISAPSAGHTFEGGSQVKLFSHSKTAANGSGDFGWGVHSGFVGFQLQKAIPGPVDYGWIKLSFTTTANGAPGSVTVVSYAYNDTGASINAGAGVPTPEPGTSSLAILAAGAAGIVALRRRRQSSN